MPSVVSNQEEQQPVKQIDAKVKTIQVLLKFLIFDVKSGSVHSSMPELLPCAKVNGGAGLQKADCSLTE